MSTHSVFRHSGLYALLLFVGIGVQFACQSESPVLQSVPSSAELLNDQDFLELLELADAASNKIERMVGQEDAYSAPEPTTPAEYFTGIGYTSSQSQDIASKFSSLGKVLHDKYLIDDVSAEQLADSVRQAIAVYTDVDINRSDSTLSSRCGCTYDFELCARGAIGSYYFNFVWTAVSGCGVGAWVGSFFPVVGNIAGCIIGGFGGIYSATGLYYHELQGCIMGLEYCCAGCGC